MKAIKLKWAYHAGMRIHFAQEEFGYFIIVGTFGLYKGNITIGRRYDTLESAKQAAQDHADKMVADMIDPDYLLALTRFAMNEGYKNATCPTLVYTAEEVLEKFHAKQKEI